MPHAHCVAFRPSILDKTALSGATALPLQLRSKKSSSVDDLSHSSRIVSLRDVSSVDTEGIVIITTMSDGVMKR